MQSLSSLGRIRQFSTTSVVQKYISHIGRRPIELPAQVSLARTGYQHFGSKRLRGLSVTGPKGSTTLPLFDFVKLEYPQPNIVSVSVDSPKERKQREVWGLTRTLIANAIIGMTEGFSVPLHLVGVGFRAAVEPDPQSDREGAVRLTMKLGHTHPVIIPVPEHITAEVPLPTRIIIKCLDKQKLGQFAAEVRRWRTPEPYKGKVSLPTSFAS
jgi:large subunit ribosomal protein L6